MVPGQLEGVGKVAVAAEALQQVQPFQQNHRLPELELEGRRARHGASDLAAALRFDLNLTNRPGFEYLLKLVKVGRNKSLSPPG
jgi:hypothetical protein